MRAEARGNRKNPAAAETMMPIATSATTFRRRRGAAGALGVARIPSGVTSNAHARMSEIGKPRSNRIITSRNAQFGNSHAGKTAEAS